MNDHLIELARKSGADYCEIRVEDSKQTAINFQGPDLENVQESHMYGGNVRVAVNGCWGFVTFNNPDEIEPRVREALESAKAAARQSKERNMLAEVEPLQAELKLDVITDPRDISLDEKIRLFGDYNQRMLDKEGVTSTNINYFDKYSRIRYANSEGASIDHESIDMGMGATALARKNGVTARSTASAGGRNDFNVFRNMDEDVDKAARNAIETTEAEVVEGGNYTVVCDPHLAGVFVHEAFGHLSEGDNVAENPRMQEILKLGRRFGEDYLNIYDTGLDAGLRGYLAYDDEGVPCQKTWLIREGELVGRLHSRETAGRMGEKPTGNARALNYRFPPIPRMRNTCIGNGPHGNLEDLIKDIKLGIYALDAYGGQTNGELFTFTAGQAFMIRDGKIAERVRDVTLGGNVFDTLKNITGIGGDYEVKDGPGGCGKAGQMPLPVSHGSPHIRIKDVVIGGRQSEAPGGDHQF
jgi:TldD protein